MSEKLDPDVEMTMRYHQLRTSSDGLYLAPSLRTRFLRAALPAVALTAVSLLAADVASAAGAESADQVETSSQGQDSASVVASSDLSLSEGIRSEGHRRYRHRYRSFGVYVSPFYWGWGSYWPYYGGWADRPYYDSNWGAIDLNVKPKSAEVFVDGGYVGRVDQFDGFPRYLWLEKGTRNVVIYKEGYESLARRVKLRPGEVIDLREQMRSGEAKTPEELFEQLQPEKEVAARTDARRAEPRTRVARRERASTHEDVHAESEEAWRQRDSREAQPRETTRERTRGNAESETAVALDQRSEPGRLVVRVDPADAVVYLDGRLLGSGEELSRLHHGLLVDAGEHTLEVVRPGYRTRVESLRVATGEDVEIDLRLDPE